MFLFLQGSPRVGKSTILRSALLPHQMIVAGLMVQRLFEDARSCGFRVCVVDGTTLPSLETAYASGMSGVFLHNGKVNLHILEDAIVRSVAHIEKAACKLIILDEIGGLELASAAFMGALDHILSLGKPCLGVIKSQGNLAHTAGCLNLPDDIRRQNENLRNRLKAAGKVLDANSENLDATARAVNEFIARLITV